MHLGELFKEGLEDFDLLRERVAIEDSSRFKGIQLIKPMLLAIKQQKYIQFVHENYLKKTHKNYEIVPLQIREYLNRWYVIGVPPGREPHSYFWLRPYERLKNNCGERNEYQGL